MVFTCEKNPEVRNCGGEKQFISKRHTSVHWPNSEHLVHDTEVGALERLGVRVGDVDSIPSARGSVGGGSSVSGLNHEGHG